MNNHFARALFYITLSLIIPSCMGVRYMQDDEYLLRRQQIEGNDEISKDAIEELYQSEANKKLPLIPFAPYVWVHHMGEKRYDSAKIEYKIEQIRAKYDKKIIKHQGKESKIKRLERNKNRKVEKKIKDLQDGNILMRWGEPVSVYEEESIEKTRQQIQLYIQNRGFFDSSVEFATETRGRKKYVTYYIEENLPYTIDTFRIITSDSTIRAFIEEASAESLLMIDDYYDQNNLVMERERIEKLLKNKGYFDFSRQYIAFDVLTDLKPYSVELNMIINDPIRRGYHKQFVIDSVIFETDTGIEPRSKKRSYFNYNGIKYQYYVKRFSKKVLDQRVFLYPKSMYSLDNTLSTQRQLAYLDNFKFININYDTTGGMFIANIFTSPLNKYQITNEVGLNVTEGYPGPFYNLSLKNRNIFKGLENLELSGFFGFEGVASATENKTYSSVESGAKLALTFPQFIMPASKEFKRRVGRNNPNTTIRSGFNFTNRPPDYDRTNFTNALIYGWQKERKQLYNFTLSEIALINSETSNNFDSLLLGLEKQGNPLIKSFQPSFVSAMNFVMVHNFNPDDFYGNKSSMLKLFGEAGGTIFNFFEPTVFQDRIDTIQYFQYLKFSSDFRRHITLNETNGIATRLNIGIAYPYGKNETLPYEKFFFVGGSNSLRAWPPRRLGPGGNKPQTNEDGTFNYSIEKPGEILIEANVEYRSKLIGFIDWAFFVDAGNVWKFYENPSFPLADFKFNRFYKEIAVGMGLGLRLNFSFLVIRFDYGVKMYDPGRDEGDRWVGDNLSLTNWRGAKGQALWNIAIGYPF